MFQIQVSQRHLSLITIGFFIATLLTVALSPGSVEAQSGGTTPFKATLTVAYIATQICETGDLSCSACINQNGFYVEAQGLADTSLGPLFAQVLKCWYMNEPPFGTYAGTLTTTVPNGKDSLTWAYSGKNDTGGDFYGFGPFSGTLTITGGTGKFAGARGGAAFTAGSGPAFSAGPSPVQFEGTAFYYIQGRVEGTQDN